MNPLYEDAAVTIYHGNTDDLLPGQFRLQRTVFLWFTLPVCVIGTIVWMVWP